MNQKHQFSGVRLAAILLVGLLLTGCVAIQPTTGNRTDRAAAATLEMAMSEDTILLWEGKPLFAEDENACGRLTIDRYNVVTIGECGQSGGETQPLSATHEREWLELQTHFSAPTEVSLIGQSLIYRPDGEAFGGAWQRALVAWAQLVHAELASGRISASGATAMSWAVGSSAEQPDMCQQLTVLRYGYAQAITLPCDGGATQTQVGGWLTDAEMIQFDVWLHQYGELYVDDSYLAGLGERTPSGTEQGELATWAETVYTRLAAHPAAAAQSDSAAWQRYRADSGYEIQYPLAHYSLRLGPQTAADVLFPGVRMVEPNDAFVLQQPGQSTYKLSIAVRASEEEPALEPALLANSALIAYTPDLLASKTIQQIELDGMPALRVDDLPVGPAGVTTQIVAIYQGRIYELLVEPHSITTNQALPYMESTNSAANQALIEDVLTTFRFVDVE